MFDIILIIQILLIHYIADYLFQVEKWAQSKSHNVLALMKHIVTYMLVFGFLLFFCLPISINSLILFLLVNGFIHFWVDFTTSKITHSLYNTQNWFWFFKVLGIDQLIHFITLFITLKYILNV